MEKGIYKTYNANAYNPSWIRLEGEQEKIPTTGFNRIALAISYSSQDIVYALMSNQNNEIDKFYRTIDGGSSWKKIDLPGTRYGGVYPRKIIGYQGKYNLNVAVDPTNHDIVYLSGQSLWKAFRN